jgi:hypothetical protein
LIQLNRPEKMNAIGALTRKQLGEAIYGKDSVGLKQENGQQCALFAPAEGEHLTIAPDFQRPQYPEFHL